MVEHVKSSVFTVVLVRLYPTETTRQSSGRVCNIRPSILSVAVLPLLGLSSVSPHVFGVLALTNEVAEHMRESLFQTRNVIRNQDLD